MEVRKDLVSGSIVVDNAFIYGIIDTFNRLNNGLLIRNVNILALSGLVDAIVMHQRLVVDRRAWECLECVLPVSWLARLSPIVDVIQFDLPSEVSALDALLGNRDLTLISFASSLLDRQRLFGEDGKSDLAQVYFAYTGSVLGPQNDERKLIALLKKRVQYPQLDLWLRNEDHVSAFQSAVRGLQYEAFATSLGLAYLPHEFRGRIMNAASMTFTDEKLKQAWKNVQNRMLRTLEGNTGRNLDWIGEQAVQSRDIWKEIKTPIFLPIVLRNAESVDDILTEATKLRENARRFRELLVSFLYSQPGENTGDILTELEEASHEISNPVLNEKSSFSISIGIPFSVSIGGDFSLLRGRKSRNFIRDIYRNHPLAGMLESDICRVFKQDRLQAQVYRGASKFSGVNLFSTFLEAVAVTEANESDL